MTTPHYSDDQVTVYHGDCLNVLAELADNSIDAVVTDPPYGLEFMGKDWDRPWAVSPINRVGYVDRDDLTLPAHRDNRNANCRACGGRQRGVKRCKCSAPQWDRAPGADMAAYQSWCQRWATECLRVLKPGGHMLAFGGTRTWHRLAAAIEDAGFEIRDSIFWIYGQGFPKSMNVSRAEQFCQCKLVESRSGDDQLRGMRAVVSDVAADAAPSEITDLFSPVQRRGSGSTMGDVRGNSAEDARSIRGQIRPGQSGVARRRDAETLKRELHRPAICEVPAGTPGDGPVGRLRDGTPSSDGAMDRSDFAPGRVRESHQPESAGQPPGELGAVPDERGSQARGVWPVCGRCGKSVVPQGLGTALKPSAEPIVVARKPLAGTVANNVLQHGTGALNIDRCRVTAGQDYRDKCASVVGLDSNRNGAAYGERTGVRQDSASPAGRWPTNVVLDDSQAAELDKQSGITISAASNRGERHGAIYGGGKGPTGPDTVRGHDDHGGASRFFPIFKYTAKAPGIERPTADGIAHPTVKPLDLMRWLVRLVAPPNGLVLDCFAGTGTTAEACIHEHKRAIVIEREASYLPLIVARLHKPMQVGFNFGEGADDD